MYIVEVVRTFLILAGGWIAGGLTILLMDAGAPGVKVSAPAAVADSSASAPSSRSGTGGARDEDSRKRSIIVPVLGVTADALRDNFLQPRGRGRTHRALDILAPRGTPVVAAVDGTIRKLFNSKAGGIALYQFDREEKHVYYYAHLERYADGVREGQFAEQGTIIGYVGTTGNAPQDTPHLHFSIAVLPPTKEWWKGEPVNPHPLLLNGNSAD